MANRTKAFTLIELLVVIAIIAILAAILFPVFAQAKAAAKKAAAISNSKQEILAELMYMGDYDGWVVMRYNAPPETGPVAPYTNQNMIWTGNLYTYVKNTGVYLDPEAPGVPHEQEPHYTDSWPDRGYLPLGQNFTQMGWYIPGNPDFLNIPRETSMRSPAATVAFMSSFCGNTAQGFRGYLARNDSVDAWNASTNAVSTACAITACIPLSDRHNAGTIVALFDGHSKWYPTSRLLGNGSSTLPCNDDNSQFNTGAFWLDDNAAHLKMNLQDACIQW